VRNAYGSNADYKLFKQRNSEMSSRVCISSDLSYESILFRVAENLTYFLACRVRFTVVEPAP
jgi:hypothetical protein